VQKTAHNFSMASRGSFGFVGSIGDSRRDNTILFLVIWGRDLFYPEATVPPCTVLLLDVDTAGFVPIASRLAITSEGI
jgi:hypothetical protein